MRQIYRIIALSLSALLLQACGQSGALQLPSDQNYDKRSQYLLYKSSQPTATAQKDSAAASSVTSQQ